MRYCDEKQKSLPSKVTKAHEQCWVRKSWLMQSEHVLTKPSYVRGVAK